MPLKFVIEQPSNFMTHCSLVTSVVAISPETSSSSGNSSSLGNWASRSSMARLFTTLGVPTFK